MPFMRAIVTAALLASSVVGTPAAAQFSDSYVLIKAVRDKDVAKAREILDKPGQRVVNARDTATGETPLIIASKRTDLPWMGYLLQVGADPNLRDNDGNSALLYTAIAGSSEAVRVLLTFKARPDLTNGLGETALIKAVQARNVEVVKLLLDAGANPDIIDHAAGYSARQYAEQDPRGAQVAKLLKEAPARAQAPMQGPSL